MIRKKKTGKKIMFVSKIKDIFSMKPKTLKEEKNKHINNNFLDYLSKDEDKYYDMNLGTIYVTQNNIVFIINKENQDYYKNYIEKVQMFYDSEYLSNASVKNMLPIISNHFENNEGKFVISINRPYQTYSLREVLNFYNGKLDVRLVTRILTDLYFFEGYLELAGMQHNELTIDNLFLSVDKGNIFDLDIKCVKVFGGWFFTTCSSSFKDDALSIKRIARELLGDISGEDLGDIPIALKNWVTTPTLNKSAYEEMRAWLKAIETNITTGTKQYYRSWAKYIPSLW